MGERRNQAVWVLGTAVLLAMLYAFFPAFRVEVQRAFALLAQADIEGVKEYILGFGIWAPVVSGSLMVLQSLAVPLPAVVITLANGMLFGAAWGALLSWSSALVGAVLCYYIARVFGRPVVEKLVGGSSLEMTDRFFRRYGRYAILIARLIPVISFDVVSYAAGLTTISFWDFVVATGIGQLPATLLYSFLGENVPRLAQWGLWALLGAVALVTLGLALKARLEGNLLSENQEAEMGNREYFEQVAPHWDEMRRGFFSEAVREKALAVADVRPGRLAVDVGAGTGFITEGLMQRGAKVIAVDPSEAMLSEMKEKFAGVADVDYRQGYAESLPIDDESVDYAFANMCLHHTENPPLAIKEMARILKPGGVLVITDLDEHNFEFLRKEHHDRWMGFKREDVRRWLMEAGLEEVNVGCVGEDCCAQSSSGDDYARVSIFIAWGRKK